MKSLQFKMLSDSEKQLVLAARPKQLRKLDEDELIELHRRVRRARNKYSKLYRRRSADQVRKDEGRGKASKKHRRIAAKAEVFEEALARVSQHLSVEARRSSEALKQERLAAAGSTRGSSSGQRRPPRSKGGSGPKRRSRDRRSIERRRIAGERSAKRRHEARRR